MSDSANSKSNYLAQAAGNRDLALAFGAAADGFFLFPWRYNPKGDKVPAIKDYLKLSTRDPKQLREWSKLRGIVHFGVDLKKSGCIVIDTDVKNNAPGPATFAALDEKHGDPLGGGFWPTFRTQTPSGGTHDWYRVTDKVKHVRKLGEQGFGAGIDSPDWVPVVGTVRESDGKEYEIIENRNVVGAPEWFAEYLTKEKVAAVDQTPLVLLDSDANVARAIDYLKNTAPESIEGQRGDATLLQVCGKLKDLAISQWKSVQLLIDHYNERCFPAWTAEEFETKVANAWSYLNAKAPGEDTAEADFAGMEESFETEAEMAARLKRTQERRQRQQQQAAPETLASLLSGWCYIGQQKRFVRKRDGMMWEKEAFNDYFGHIEVVGRSMNAPLGKYLLTVPLGHAHAMQKFDTFCYRPGLGENVNGAYNQYVPSSIQSKQGDTSIWDAHLIYLFPDPKIRKAVLDWLAWVLQNLDKKPKHALLIRGELQGTGKSWIGDVLAMLIGVQNRSPIDQGDFETPHNGYQLRAKLITCEELRSLSLAASRKVHSWITQEWLKVNEKNMPQVTIVDLIAYLFFSNKVDALPVDESDRRYLVAKTDAKPRDRAYYCRLYDVLDNPDALGAIMHQLLTRDLKGWTAAGAAEYTEAKGEMIEESAGDLQSYLIERAGEKPFSYSLVTLDEIMSSVPRAYHPKYRAMATLREILRRKFNGEPLRSAIEPYGKKGDQLRVWAIGSPQKVAATLKLSWSQQGALYLEEHAPPGVV